MEVFKKPLFIFELANNHMGSVDHGLRIIREVHEAVKGFRPRFHLAVKFQYRDLETFIHPDFRGRSEYKYVKRFSETRLTEEQFLALKTEAAKLGFWTICTPFDENSVSRIEAHGYDVVKIASCSLTDWPLLERIARCDKPIIASVAGSPLEDVDRVVAFFLHRGKDLTLMHCVAEYPTAEANLQLNQIDLLRARYPQVRVGYSTHEPPEHVTAVQLAVAKGASVFEKHVGVATEKYKLNDYSATPPQVRKWLESAQTAFGLCGVAGRRMSFGGGEVGSLRELRRGVFARRPLPKGHKIAPDDVLLAIPTVNEQLTANDLSKYVDYYAEADLPANAPLLLNQVRKIDNQQQVYHIIRQINTLLKQSGVQVPRMLDLEISHHYGIDRFEEFGCTLINFINREYCKKLILILPGQVHPEQYHKVKEETFQVLYGKLRLTLDGALRDCQPPDIVTIERGMRHAFASTTGAIIEEISSTHFVDDSFYTDPAIATNKHRKTLITHWMD